MTEKQFRNLKENTIIHFLFKCEPLCGAFAGLDANNNSFGTVILADGENKEVFFMFCFFSQAELIEYHINELDAQISAMEAHRQKLLPYREGRTD
jgi:hypothetical protein